ncbi:MAG: hypothetical protein IJZ79_05460 [Bacilli bacterium]|nr:hypothetical protein [Bacilli bacterium]
MIERINKLCQIFIDNELVNDRLLIENGFTNDDIEKFIEYNYIRKINNDNYMISIYDLYKYGERLSKHNKEDLEYKCYQKCYELDSNHINTNLRLMLKSLREYNYNGTYKYVIPLINSKEPTNKSDGLLYLYLLSFIIKIPNELKEIIKEIKFNDIKITNTNQIYKDLEITNQIRFKIINKKITHALKLLNDYLSDKKRYGMSNNILKSLLIRCLQIKEYDQNQIYNFIFDHNYQELLSFLCNKLERSELIKSQESVFRITKIILLSEIFGKLPDMKGRISISVFDAINNNDYHLARELCIQRNEKYNKNKEDDYLYLILNEICNKEYLDNDIYISNHIYEEISPYNILFITYLKDNNKSKARGNLYKYLDNNNKLEYFEMFTQLSENITSNNTYIELMFILNYIIDDNDIEKINIYTERLITMLDNNEIESSYIYIKIINIIKEKITDEYVISYINYITDYALMKLREMRKDNSVKKLIRLS